MPRYNNPVLGELGDMFTSLGRVYPDIQQQLFQNRMARERENRIRSVEQNMMDYRNWRKNWEMSQAEKARVDQIAADEQRATELKRKQDMIVSENAAETERWNKEFDLNRRYKEGLLELERLRNQRAVDKGLGNNKPSAQDRLLAADAKNTKMQQLASDIMRAMIRYNPTQFETLGTKKILPSNDPVMLEYALSQMGERDKDGGWGSGKWNMRTFAADSLGYDPYAKLDTIRAIDSVPLMSLMGQGRQATAGNNYSPDEYGPPAPQRGGYGSEQGGGYGPDGSFPTIEEYEDAKRMGFVQ